MTARAWTFTKRGGPQSVLSLTTGLPVPTATPPAPAPKDAPKPEEWIAVKVAYAGLNPGALFHMRLVPAWARAAVATPEMDFSGTVTDVWTPSDDAAGAGPAAEPTTTAPRFRKGDAVAAFIPIKHAYPTGTGALASHVAIPAQYAVPLPAGVSLRQAGGLFLAACSACMLVEAAAVGEGDRVLVNAAAGGIGTFAVQLVRSVVGERGRVVAVCSAKDGKMDLVRELGADEVVDYAEHQPLSKELAVRYKDAPFDAIVDCVGIQELYKNCAAYLKPGGIYGAIGLKPRALTYWGFVKAVFRMELNTLWPLSPWLLGTGRRWKTVAMMDPGTELLEKVMALLADGTVKVVVDSVWSMEQAPDAYAVLEGGHSKGKVLVKVDDDVD